MLLDDFRDASQLSVTYQCRFLPFLITGAESHYHAHAGSQLVITGRVAAATQRHEIYRPPAQQQFDATFLRDNDERAWRRQLASMA